jgi:hypothetical protein
MTMLEGRVLEMTDDNCNIFLTRFNSLVGSEMGFCFRLPTRL